MTYTELKEKWDAAMRSRDHAIKRGDAYGIEGNISMLNGDSATLLAVINQLLIKLAEDEKKEAST